MGGEAKDWAEMHPPEVMRKGSNLFHWMFGAILGIVAMFAIVQSFGILVEGLQVYIWPSLLLFSGTFLTTFLLLHHGKGKLKLTAKATRIDPQQRQHSIMGLLIALGALTEVVQIAASLPIGIILPLALFIVGVMFIMHAQHGTGEATHKAVRYHRILGIAFSITSLLQISQLALPEIPAYSWGAGLLIVALLLGSYREPKGAYERPQTPHEMTH